MAQPLVAELTDDLEASARAVLARAHAAGMRLATAESCTGGLVASLLTDVEGYSRVFEQGLVVYSDAAKSAVLGIPPALLAAEGAVSRPVAVAMAERTLALSRADVAFAVTGFAGAGGTGDEEGLVHFACAARRGSTIHREAHYGSIGRTRVREQCVKVAMAMFSEQLR